MPKLSDLVEKFNVNSSLIKFYFKNIATEWFKDIEDPLGSGSQEM